MPEAVAYQRHRPEKTPLHRIVSDHLESFLTFVTERYGRRLPRYVENEFRHYVECGILSYGFSRARCRSCDHEILVAFSCKLRGLCPSCNARRMCDTAAHLVDSVLPDARLRQWVLSVPFELRILLAANPTALSTVGRIFCQEISRWQKTQALLRGHGHTRGGAICFPQRFGGSLNLNVHYHVVAPDAVFVKTHSSQIVAIELRQPTRDDLDEVTMNTAVRVCNWLRRVGLIRADPPPDLAPSPLLDCLRGSLGVGDLLPDKRENARVSAHETFKAKQGLVGQHGHFNVHAGVSIAAGQPEQRERLLRYCARAPLSLERLSLLDDGRIAYQVKHAYRGQAAVRIMTPMQFMARLAALIPPPRHPLIRFHGVFAPNSKWRSAVVPKPPNGAPSAPHTSCTHDPNSTHGSRAEPTARATPKTHSLGRAVTSAPQPVGDHAPLAARFIARLDWATLLKRVYNIDALACPKCGGRLRFVEIIEDPGQARSVLRAMGLPATPPPLAKARAPDWDEN